MTEIDVDALLAGAGTVREPSAKKRRVGGAR